MAIEDLVLVQKGTFSVGVEQGTNVVSQAGFFTCFRLHETIIGSKIHTRFIPIYMYLRLQVQTEEQLL